MTWGWFSLTQAQWLVLIGCGLLIGMAKAGIAGTGLMIVPIMAYVFGGKVSTGLVLLPGQRVQGAVPCLRVEDHHRGIRGPSDPITTF